MEWYFVIYRNNEERSDEMKISINTMYWVVNGIQYQRWLKIVSLTVSLLTDNWLVNTMYWVVNGMQYQRWLKISISDWFLIDW